jgi:hypothetical protein
VQLEPGAATTEQLPSAAQHAPVGTGGVKVIVKVGRRVASLWVRLLKRFATRVVFSLLRTIQP